MKKALKTLVFCVLLALENLIVAESLDSTSEKETIPISSEDKNVTNCHTNSLDSTVQWIFYLQHPTRKIPVNISEFQEFCTDVEEAENRIDDYAKNCLKALPRTLTSLLMFGVRRQNHYYCSTSSKAKDDYLHSARCLTLVKPSGEKCMNSLVVDMLSVLSSPSNKRIGRLCW